MSDLIPERLLGVRIIDKDHPIAYTTIVKADNAFDYIWSEKEQGKNGHFERSKLTYVVPPFPNLFIQWKWGDSEMGVLLQTDRVHHELAEWIIRASLWFSPKMQIKFGSTPLVNYIIPVAADGNYISIDSEFDKQWDYSKFEGDKVFDDVATFLGFVVTVALFVVNLMNCKNVIVEEQPLSKREKRMEEKHNKPAFRYHLLKVRSARHVYDLDIGGGKRDDYSTHICRGHFKTYTDEAPLMGRFVGTYWWDAHVRGRDKAHVVDKDYETQIASGAPIASERKGAGRG